MADLELTYQDLLLEVGKAQKRVAKEPFVEAKKELANETYPLLESMIEFFGSRLAAAEAAIAEVIDQTESFIQPELADQIHGALAIGRLLVEQVRKLRPGTLDPMTLKRLQQVCVDFIKNADETDVTVAHLTVSPPEEETGDEGEEDDEDEEDEEDGDEEEVTNAAPETPPPAEEPTKPVQEQP